MRAFFLPLEERPQLTSNRNLPQFTGSNSSLESYFQLGPHYFLCVIMVMQANDENYDHCSSMAQELQLSKVIEGELLQQGEHSQTGFLLQNFLAPLS